MRSCYRSHWLYYVLAGLIVLMILAYFFQWQAAYAILPFLLILCCPLMMLMMGHGEHGSHGHKNKDDESARVHH